MADPKKSEEIDLISLLLKAVTTIRANFLTIVVFFLVGTAVGLAYYFSARKVYENKMIISSNILTESYGKTLFENANRYVREGNVGVLAEQFGVSEATASQLVTLTIETLAKSESEDQKESERLLITVEVLNPAIYPELQKGIINFLENNEFAKIRVEQRKAYFKQMLATAEAEIKDLEELKVKIFKGEFFQNSKGAVMLDPTNVNAMILELTEKKIGFEDGLKLANSVQVIEGFTRFQRQISPKLSLSLVSGSLVGLMFVGFLIAFKSIQKLLEMAASADNAKT